MGTFRKQYDTQAEAIITPCVFITTDQLRRLRTDSAVWDTGSTATIISSRLAKQLNAKAYSKGSMSGIGGEAEGDTYLLHVLLPTGDAVTYVEVYETPLEDYDAIIGMDLITLGNMHLDSIGGKTTFTFSLPDRA